MSKKQVGITKPIMVVSDLLSFIVKSPELKFKLNFVNMLYGKIREQLKEGKIDNINDVEKVIDSLPPFIKTKIENENSIKKEELDIIFDRIIKHSKLISIQNENIAKNFNEKSDEAIKLEEALSNNIFKISVEQPALSHAGMFSIISVLPFIDTLQNNKELLLSYLNFMPETIAAMKLANTYIVSQIKNTQSVEDVITFGKPSFLAMATTATTKNTDNVSLLSDLVTTTVVLKNDPDLKLELNKEEMSSLLALVENEAKKIPRKS